MRECKVSPRGAHYSATIRDFDPIGGHRREVRSCCYCNEVTPLGPSDESDPRVAVEVRAAEIATTYVETNLVHTLGTMTFDEEHGWRDYLDDVGGDCPCSTSATRHPVMNWHTGHLAHAITTHGSET